MDFKKIDRVSVSSQVYDQMRQMILEGKWKPGDRIPSENELAEAFGVSRVSIRHALQKLGAIGLVETKLGDGSYVCQLTMGANMNQLIPAIYLSEDSIREVLEFRIMTEVEAAALAATRATKEDINKLRACYEKMLESQDDLRGCVYLDFHFHRLIMSISRNSVAVQVHYILREVLQETMVAITKQVGNRSGKKYHKLIIDAIARHDSEDARQYMKEHLVETLKLYDEDTGRTEE